jgi:DNA-binding PadR family transcriptional regulator
MRYIVLNDFSQAPVSTRPLASSTFYVLLALADRERYGLDVVEDVARRTNEEVILGPGSLYNTIKKLLADGLIEETAPKERGDSRELDPRRRYYRITRTGRAALTAEARRLSVLVEAARDKKVLPAR